MELISSLICDQKTVISIIRKINAVIVISINTWKIFWSWFYGEWQVPTLINPHSILTFFGFNIFLFWLALLHYLLRIQYNIIILIRNATSNNLIFHSNNMLKDYDFNIKVITLITYKKINTKNHLKPSQHINATSF